MSVDYRREGIKASDLPPERLEELLKKGYTISPNSGRLRKKIKGRSSGPVVKKKSWEKYVRMILWIILLCVFLASVLMILPEFGILSNDKSQEKDQRRVPVAR